MTLRAALDVALVVIVLALSSCVVMMVAARITRAIGVRRRRRAESTLRSIVVAAASGEPPPQLTVSGGRQRVLVDLTLDYLTKVTGEGRDHLRALLAAQGRLDAVRRDLSSRRAVHRARAAVVLGAAGDPQDLDRLATLLDDPDFEVRATAVRALGQLADPDAIDALLAHVGDPEHRLAFGTVVMALAAPGASGALALLDALTAGEIDARRAAAEALGIVGTLDAVDALVRAAEEDRDPDVRVRARRALGRIGSPRGVPTLVEGLADERVAVRAVSARALGAVGANAAHVIAALSRAACDDEVVVAVNAASTLAQLGTPGRMALDALAQRDVPTLAVAEARSLAALAVGAGTAS